MNIQIFKVGGCVRDRLLREEGFDVPEGDVDWVVTGATPEEMLARGFMPVGSDFPVFLHPKTHEEYALARTERKTARGYHGFSFYASPDVSLEQDLLRRDLTINAMAEDAEGRIIDPWGGRRDLKMRTLRHVSDAFAEDPVRILRLARFAARFPSFVVAPETLSLCRQMVENGEADALVAERIWQELRRGLSESNPGRMIEVLKDCGAWERLFGDIPLGNAVCEALSRAASRRLAVEIRAAVLFSGFGDALRLRARLQALRVEADTISVCELTSRLHRRVSRFESADDYVALLEAADVLRRPVRFELFLSACAVLHPEADLTDLRRAARAFVQTDAGKAARAAGGRNIAQIVRQARLKAVRTELDNLSSRC